MTTTYMSGALVRTKVTFTDITGAVADPTTVTLKYKKDAGSVTTVVYPAAGIVKEGTGVYHADLDTSGWAGPALQGWIIEWIGTGTCQAINKDLWLVEPPAL